MIPKELEKKLSLQPSNFMFLSLPGESVGGGSQFDFRVILTNNIVDFIKNLKPRKNHYEEWETNAKRIYNSYGFSKDVFNSVAKMYGGSVCEWDKEYPSLLRRISAPGHQENDLILEDSSIDGWVFNPHNIDTANQRGIIRDILDDYIMRVELTLIDYLRGNKPKNF
jgi:hypothetical protein